MPKVVFHTHIPELKHFMEDLPRIVDEEGTTIKTGRNEIKIIERGGVQFCVKAFNKVAALNILMYSWFRQTKAKRSFLTARALLQRGIETPMPIGYTEVIGGGKIVRQSFYVSLYQNFDWHLADALQRDHPEEQAITAAYGRFMAEKVHPAGIWHKDMSTGNIMINRNRGKYAFSIVDLNRICFKKKISPAAGMYN
ncbi:MAG: lipopolysaccharide kinase InaA family protein, partial [Marinilabilia sp.]